MRKVAYGSAGMIRNHEFSDENIDTAREDDATRHELHDYPDLESDLYRATLYIWLLTRKTDPDAK